MLHSSNIRKIRVIRVRKEKSELKKICYFRDFCVTMNN